MQEVEKSRISRVIFYDEDEIQSIKSLFPLFKKWLANLEEGIKQFVLDSKGKLSYFYPTIIFLKNSSAPNYQLTGPTIK